jgi:tRNA A37 threonylcarbamoyladenosine biosynthesis protein TsaE
LDRFSGRASEEFEWALSEDAEKKLAVVEWGERVSQKTRGVFSTTIQISFSWHGDEEYPGRKISLFSHSSSLSATDLEREFNLFLNDGKRWKA